VLTEIPEVFGAENVLLQRAASREIFDQAVGVIDDFKRYFIDNNQPIYENPSPGNIAGGITTLEEKSLGAVQKGGRARWSRCCATASGRSARPDPAGSPRQRRGVVDGPDGRRRDGDPVHHRSRHAAGLPRPDPEDRLELGLAQRKPGWIDFDAGQVLEGVSMDDAADSPDGPRGRHRLGQGDQGRAERRA
jgi:altronate hydrolase